MPHVLPFWNLADFLFHPIVTNHLWHLKQIKAYAQVKKNIFFVLGLWSFVHTWRFMHIVCLENNTSEEFVYKFSFISLQHRTHFTSQGEMLFLFLYTAHIILFTPDQWAHVQAFAKVPFQPWATGGRCVDKYKWWLTNDLSWRQADRRTLGKTQMFTL